MKECSHPEWVETERRQAIKNFTPPSWFANGYVQYEDRILQKCKTCGMLRVVAF